jgi:cephalosporin hydroxylase
MKLTIDTESSTLAIEGDAEARTLPLYSREAFEALSRQWVRVGWNQKYQYTFTWLGRPVIQLPEDMLRTQEVLYRLRPDVITLVEGSSTAPDVLDRVRGLVAPGESVLVLLDSNHTCEHVLAELRAYGPLVTPGSYIVATDGIMHDLADVPRGRASWTTDNPICAARDFVASHPEFVVEQPAWPFNESGLGMNITHWPGAWLRRT